MSTFLFFFPSFLIPHYNCFTPFQIFTVRGYFTCCCHPSSRCRSLRLRGANCRRADKGWNDTSELSVISRWDGNRRQSAGLRRHKGHVLICTTWKFAAGAPTAEPIYPRSRRRRRRPRRHWSLGNNQRRPLTRCCRCRLAPTQISVSWILADKVRVATPSEWNCSWRTSGELLPWCIALICDKQPCIRLQ